MFRSDLVRELGFRAPFFIERRTLPNSNSTKIKALAQFGSWLNFVLPRSQPKSSQESSPRGYIVGVFELELTLHASPNSHCIANLDVVSSLIDLCIDFGSVASERARNNTMPLRAAWNALDRLHKSFSL